MKIKLALLVIGNLYLFNILAQKIIPYNEAKEFKIAFNETGSHYVKLTFLNQVWLRYNESNPGTLVNTTPMSETFDIGLRRTRIQLFGQLSDRVFFYSQFGQNNLSFNSNRKQGLFFLDAVSEYVVAKRSLSLGAGLTGWTGVSRYSSPSVGTILTMDAPLYQQTTNDINDQFLRKLSVYAKGKLGKLDYRLVLSNPMSVQKASTSGGDFGFNSSFSTLPGKLQAHGYFSYQFKDEESNLTPYTTGSYLGKKSIFNIGGGFLVQPDAMWRLNENMDTIQTDLKIFSFDVFYDVPLNETKKNAITLYGAFQNSDFGKHYLRNIGAMNPGTTVNSNGSINGTGSAFPTIGTGNTIYIQGGYLFKHDLLGTHGTFQPNFGIQYSKFDVLNDAMFTYDLGVNWIIDGHRSKISLNYQNRPVFTTDSNSDNRISSRRSMIVLQYQISF